MQVIAWTWPARIIGASERPIRAVLMAPASVTIIFPPASRWPRKPFAQATSSRAL